MEYSQKVTIRDIKEDPILIVGAIYLNSIFAIITAVEGVKSGVRIVKMVVKSITTTTPQQQPNPLPNNTPLFQRVASRDSN